MVSAPNALYRAGEMHRSRRQTSERIDVIVIGRLVEDKRPLLALRAFALACRPCPTM